MASLGRTILMLGIILVGVGAAILLSSRIGLPLGRLPGDLHWRSRTGSTHVYFPLATSILLSILLSLVLWLFHNLHR
jgi:hypothetical protein